MSRETSNVLVVQNTRVEGLGYLGKLLEQDGFNITCVNAKHEKLVDGAFSLVVILGAPQSANDDLPYLQAEQQLICDSVDREIPVLGICLGSQLIAKAFGARVYKGAQAEIGFYDNLQVCSDSTLFSGFENPFTVFHWHGDTFDLPAGATLLASSEHYRNQAFRYKCAVGLQFHLEVNEEMIRLWLENARDTLETMPHISSQKILSDIAKNMGDVKSNMNMLYNNFKSSFDL